MSTIINSLTAKVTLIFMLLASPIVFAQNEVKEIAYEQRLETKVELTKEEWVKYHASQMQLDQNFVLNLQKLDAKLYCLAQNNFFEARGEDIVGKVAISEVVTNRAESGDFPGDVCAVVRQNTVLQLPDPTTKRTVPTKVCQFSWYCDGKGSIPVRKPNGLVDPHIYKEWYDCVVAAMIVHTGKFRGLVGNAVYFYDHKSVRPSWAKRLQKVEVIGNHTFMAPKE